MKYILFTIDVEDWFQVENLKRAIPFSSWASRDMRVERNTHRLLDFLDLLPLDDLDDLTGLSRSINLANPTRIKATFFILGWVAERLPDLVREIHSRGHEVASHGYYHNLCSESSLDELKRDLVDSKKILEDMLGHRVYGYRAPSFSIHNEALSIIEEAGYAYDSSLNAFAMNSRYGKLDLTSKPRIGIARHVSNGFYELPISQLNVGNWSFPLGGGGFFRFLPVSIFASGVRSILDKQEAYLFYIHPWEIDSRQPRVSGLPIISRFRHYMNLGKTLSKLSVFLNYMEECQFVTCSRYLQEVIK